LLDEQGGAGETGSALASQVVADRLIAANGTVEPVSEVRRLAATVIGRLTATMANEGDHVTAGEVIAEIENSDLKARLADSEASLIARQNELLRLRTGARPQEIAAAKAELREADAALTVARSTYDRRVALGAKEIVSKEALEQARADADAAAAHRDLLADRLALVVAPPRVEDAAIAEANVKAAEANVAEIKAEIEKTLVRSPIDGVLLKLYRRTGETVSNLPPTLIAAVGDTSRLRIRADIDEADVAQIAVGQSVEVTADAYPGRSFPGTVAQVGSQLGAKTILSDAPQDRIDRKALEVLIDLAPGIRLPIGLPVDIRVKDTPHSATVSQASHSAEALAADSSRRGAEQ
jgi:HlyD family secretion protein